MRHELFGKHRPAIFAAFTIADGELQIFYVDILHSQPQALGQAQPAAVHQAGRKPVLVTHAAENPCDLAPRQHDRHADRPFRPHHVLEPGQVLVQHLLVEEKESAQSLVKLGGMNRRYLVFDRDGTISDPVVGIARSLNFALTAFGFEPIPDNGLAKYIGPPLDDTLRRIAPFVEEECIVQLVSTYRQRYSDVGYSENVLYLGIPEALCYLVENGCHLGICTSKRGDFAERILKHFEIHEFFQFVNGGDVGTEEHQQLQHLLADNVVDISATMIGDRAVDIEAARTNGLRSVGVLWGYGTEAELIEAEADLLLSFPSQLMELANAA